MEVAVSQYYVYASIHQKYPLNLALFSQLLEKLVKPLQTNGVSEEDTKLFWEATKKLLPSCFSIIRKIRKKSSNEKAAIKQVIEVLKILQFVNSLDTPQGFDLFPSTAYPWIYKREELSYNIAAVLSDAVSQGANDWLNNVIETKVADNTNIAKLQHFIEIIKLVRSDLQKAIEYYDKFFQE